MMGSTMSTREIAASPRAAVHRRAADLPQQLRQGALR